MAGEPALRILLVTRRFTWDAAGGGEVDAKLIASWMAEHGHQVDVFAVETGGTRAESAPEGLRVHQAPGLRVADIKAAIRAHRPDVVHSYNMEGSPEAVRAARAMGVPVAVTANSAWATCLFADMYRPGHGICETCTVTGVRQCFERRPPASIGRRVPAVVGWGEVQRRLFFLRRADRVVVLSDASKDLLTRNGVPEEKIEVIPTWVKPAFARAPSAAPEGEIILYAGALTFSKGTDVLVRAFARLAPRRPEARLVFVGRGPNEEELRRIAREAGVEDRVDFMGYVHHAEAPAWYRRARVFAFPIRSEEAFANVILESWSSGLPIVASGISAPAHVIRDGVDGLLVPPEDPEALARALERVLAEEGLAARLAEGGRARLPEYAMDGIMRRLVDLYRRLVAGHTLQCL